MAERSTADGLVLWGGGLLILGAVGLSMASGWRGPSASHTLLPARNAPADVAMALAVGASECTDAAARRAVAFYTAPPPDIDRWVDDTVKTCTRAGIEGPRSYTVLSATRTAPTAAAVRVRISYNGGDAERIETFHLRRVSGRWMFSNDIPGQRNPLTHPAPLRSGN